MNKNELLKVIDNAIDSGDNLEITVFREDIEFSLSIYYEELSVVRDSIKLKFTEDLIYKKLGYKILSCRLFKYKCYERWHWYEI